VQEARHVEVCAGLLPSDRQQYVAFTVLSAAAC
jgi:hypothetical protein